MSNVPDDAINFDIDYSVLPEDEGLFARDVDGQLIRVEKATADELEKTVTLVIDGVQVVVNQAVPECDSQGNIKQDADGKPIPRPTTIYDAAYKAFVTKPGEQHPIPALCHREHLPPVGVCRVCVVELVEESRGAIRKKLVPSCKQAVKDGMVVHTINSSDEAAAGRVKNASRTVVELLIADHGPDQATVTPGNELVKVAERLDADPKRFSPLPVTRGQDESSHMIHVDHDQCILCGRCQRGCNWIKGNNVIGRGGKGYDSRIVFDLNNSMEESTCVSCGECAVSCPTGALEFQKDFIETQVDRVRKELKDERKDGDIVTADELIKYDLFKDIPYKFLQFNGAAVVRRMLKPGQELCRQGEYGATAFIILDGEFEIDFNVETGSLKNRRSGGLLGRLFGRIDTVRETSRSSRKPTLGDVGEIAYEPGNRILRNKDDVILGEMTCMNRGVRSATVRATKESHVLEIRRNVLYMLQRNQVSREILDKLYRERALKGQLGNLPLFESLDQQMKEDAAAFLADRASYVLVDPLQPIFEQGDLADAYYVNKLGSVKVTQKYGRDERVLNYLGPGSGFGEIGLLSGLTDELNEDVLGEANRGRRTATCSALDHVELYRIDGNDFRELLERYPQIRKPLLDNAKKLLKSDREAESRLQAIDADSFLEQGLYMAQSLLVLDLERCTRCDECTKACADAHQDGVTRLIREGLRFDKFLVASSCRSCLDPLCLVGCPVDAIHRDGDSKEIEIEDYCIGCGLCANQCPYGNINMHGFKSKDSGGRAVVQQRATTCDLCRDAGGPSCVHACPHDAAHRMTGDQLKQLVSR